jgi:uncharacterized protein with GYD domain
MKFVTLINFTEQGVQRIGESTQRAATFAEQAKSAGLKISELLWLSGRFDGLVVYEAPDVETASAVMLKLAKTGNVKTETLTAFDSAGMQNVLERI